MGSEELLLQIRFHKVKFVLLFYTFDLHMGSIINIRIIFMKQF